MRARWTVALAMLAGTLLVGCSSELVTNLEVGDCYNAANTYEGQEVATVPIVDCEKEHTAEVYLVTTITGLASYDEAAVNDFALNACVEGFEGYVGVDYWDSSVDHLDFQYIYPLADSWADGNRMLTCAVVTVDPNGTLTGSMKDAFAAS